MNKLSSYFYYLGLVFTVICLLSSNIFAQKVNWKSANVYYKDGRVEKGLLKTKKTNFWYYQILNVNNNEEYLYPENVTQIISEDYCFVSFVFSQPEFNHITSSFANVLSGDDVCLIHTRISYKVCNCNKGERYIWAYFVLSGDVYLKIDTKGKRKYINNKDAVKEFLNKSEIYEVPQQSLESIQDLNEFLGSQ